MPDKFEQLATETNLTELDQAARLAAAGGSSFMDDVFEIMGSSNPVPEFDTDNSE